MQEFSTQALVLAVHASGEADGRVVLFTETAGKVVARAKSLFKPKGKLAAHLQPLSLVTVRLVEKKGVQVVDALMEKRLLGAETPILVAAELLGVARLIDELTQPRHPDAELWRLINSGELISRDLLRVLGFDPEHARCERCGKSSPAHFILKDAVYVCAECFKALRYGAALGVRLGA